MKRQHSHLYLDYNATTPCDPQVVEAMLPFFSEEFGNASSSHHVYGWMAKNAVDEVTDTISRVLGVSSKELVYTSGATESINQVLKGLFGKHGKTKNHIIATKVEHKAVLDVCAFLEEEGAMVTYLGVNTDGLINLSQLEDALSQNTLLVSILFANNETGVIQHLEEISKLCRQKGCYLFSDATQALGRVPIDDFFSLVDFACFSGHKVYGPKGVGLTYMDSKHLKDLDSFIRGGGQQRGLRGGTYNVPAIVGLAKAIELAHSLQKEEHIRLQALRNNLELGLSSIEVSQVNGKGADRLPNTLNMSFDFIDGEQLLRGLSRHIAVSNGSACNSGSTSPSHVLTAMGVPESYAFASLRFSLGRYTTQEDVEKTIAVVKEEVERQRAHSVLWERRKS